MTAANVILGTAAYMSPEQARGKTVDRRADIWAFGCVLYECLTGRRAFAGETVSDTLAKILERDPDLAALPTGTPTRLRELLRYCLAKDPKLRLRDIGDARIVLDEVLASRSPSGRLLIGESAGGGDSGRPRSRGVAPLWVGLGAVTAVGLGIGLGSTVTGHGGALRCTSIQIPSDLVVSSGEIRRDGHVLVVAARPRSGNGTEASPSRVYVRPLDSFEFKPLPGTEGAAWAGTSLDSRTLFFTAPVQTGASQYRFFRMPIDGSAPAIALFDWQEGWGGGCELSNGDFLMLVGTSFFRLPKAGGTPSPATRIDADRPGVRDVTLGDALPGDRGVLTTLGGYGQSGWHYNVGVLDPRTGKVKVVVEDGGRPVYVPTGYLLFSRDDVVLAVRFDIGRLETRGPAVAVWKGLSTPFSTEPGHFAVTRDGSLFYRPGKGGGARALAFLDLSGHLQPWSSERWHVEAEFVMAPDGHHFACMILNPRGIDEIWISDVSRPGFRRLGTDPNADCFWPRWSPDGKLIAYQRVAKDDRDGIYVQPVEGGEAKRIFAPRAEGYAPSAWLPGGSGLIVSSAISGRRFIKLLTLAGAEADSSRLRPLLPSRFSVYTPRISPDERMLAFTSEASGRAEIFVAEFGADASVGRPLQVSTEGGSGESWSPDGGSLYYDDAHGKMLKVSVRRTPVLSVSSPVQVFDLQKLGIFTYCVLPDDRFLVALRTEDEGEITRYDVVLNWTDELTRKMQAAR